MSKALFLALSLLAAPALAQEPIPVVTTTSDLRSLVEAVGGERVQARTLGAGVRLRGARLLVKVGAGFEPWLDVAKLPKSLRVVDASKGVRLVHGNAHYWLDPHNAQPVTASILAALTKLSPADEARFQANRDAFLTQLNEKIFRWEKRLAPLSGAKVLAMRGDWIYFGERFGFRVVSAAVAARTGETDFALLIADPRSDPARVARLAGKTGARVVTLLPSGEDYVGLFEENVRRLAEK